MSTGDCDDYQRAQAMMPVKIWVMAALLALAMCSTAMGQARPPEADPAVWGVYARLLGTGWRGESGTRATRWGQGDQIIEDDSIFGQSVITRGPTPGTLSLRLGSTSLHTFQGTIASDGSVLWIREGMIKMPYRVLLRDGELVEEAVKLSGREVVSVKSEIRYQQVEGLPIASPSAPDPAVSTAVVSATAASDPQAAAKGPQPGQVQDGKASTPILRPSVASFGPYAALDELAYFGAEGWYVHWYLSQSGATMVIETRGSKGELGDMQIIQPTTQGNLIMLRGGYCPDEVCGQTGVVTEGMVTWREPKASSGRTGEVMEVRMWLEGNGRVLVTQTTNPHPADGGPPMVLAPYAVELVQAPQRSAEMLADSASMVANLESRIAVDVAQALGKQLAARQEQDDAMEARRRSSERVQSFNRLMGSANTALVQANAGGGYDEAQANLNAAVANIQDAAAAERRAQALAQQQAPTRVEDYPAEGVEPASQQLPEQPRVASPEPSFRSAADGPDVSARSADSGGPVEMFVFFVNLGGKTVAFEGPLALSREEGRAMKARLEGEAPGRYGAGATVDARSRGRGWCAFVYQRPGEEHYIMGSETTLLTTTNSMKGMVQNLNAVIHHDVVCP